MQPLLFANFAIVIPHPFETFKWQCLKFNLSLGQRRNLFSIPNVTSRYFLLFNHFFLSFAIDSPFVILKLLGRVMHLGFDMSFILALFQRQSVVIKLSLCSKILLVCLRTLLHARLIFGQKITTEHSAQGQIM